MNVVLSYGLGVDSTALLLRWLEEPDSRDFDLEDLLVVTAMTGDEWPRTGVLVEQHILPRLREAGVRFAQVARAGRRESEGIVVLDDSSKSARLHIVGAYKLSTEMEVAGTVPQVSGNRICSMKFKGWVIDTYLAAHAPEATRHAFGYEAEEGGRAKRCEENMPGRLVFGFEAKEPGRARRATAYDTPRRVAEFPLIEWGWDRADCQNYIHQVTGVPDWPKSACVYCPFALTNRAGRERALRRYVSEPESALQALLLERRALCLNPRSGLTPTDSLFDLLWVHTPELIVEFEDRLAQLPHSLYEVRRIWRPQRRNPAKANANRDLRVLASGSRADCETQLRRRGAVVRADQVDRVYLRRRGSSLPAREQFLVSGPAGAEEKAMPSFSRWWSEAEQPQLALAA